MRLGHDLRVVGRGLLRAPGLTLLVVLTLGMGIGANQRLLEEGTRRVPQTTKALVHYAANPPQLVPAERMVLREVAGLVVAGATIGLALFLAGNRVLGSMLFEVSPDDPLTIAAAAAGLAVMATMAGLLPARRAARVDPAVTLRRE